MNLAISGNNTFNMRFQVEGSKFTSSPLKHIENINLKNRKQTQFCDHQSSEIKNLVNDIKKITHSERGFLSKSFYFVRDEIKYSLGLYSHTATDTLENKFGSCSNKANLLVAIYRCAGYEAAFKVMRVKTKQYFGPLCTRTFSQFMSEESNHIYLCVKIDGEWVDVDPTDDLRLSRGVGRYCQQGKVVDFDGLNHARLSLDPEHIISDPKEGVSTIDAIFRKKRRIDERALDLLNLYLEYIRDFAKDHAKVEDLEASFMGSLPQINDHKMKKTIMGLMEIAQ